MKVVRLFNVFGRGRGPTTVARSRNFITQALRSQPITVYGDGSTKPPSWKATSTTSSATLERFFWLDGTDFPGPLNVGNAREIPVIDVARFVQSLFPALPIVHMPPTPRDRAIAG